MHPHGASHNRPDQSLLTGGSCRPCTTPRNKPGMKTKTAILILCLPCIHTACTTTGMSPQGRAIYKASVIAQQAIHETSKQFYSKPQAFLLRHNPAPCDPNLAFDAKLMGQWQKIAIKGSQTALHSLRIRAKEAGPGTPFEARLIITRDRYLSQQHQTFHTLIITD